MAGHSSRLTSRRASRRLGVPARGRRGVASAGPLRFRAPKPGSRHHRPGGRARVATVGRSGYRGNRGASSLWAATISRRHFQTALVPEPLAQREEPVRAAGPQGDAPRRKAATGTEVRLAPGGEAAEGRAGSRSLRGGSPREEVGEGGAGTVRRGRVAGWLPVWTGKCPGGENDGSTFLTESRNPGPPAA